MVWRGCMPTNDLRQSLLLTTTKTSNPHFHGLWFHPHVIVRAAHCSPGLCRILGYMILYCNYWIRADLQLMSSGQYISYFCHGTNEK